MINTQVSTLALLIGLGNYPLIASADQQGNAVNTGHTMEEVLVTGSKRGAQSVQDTPYNISALGEAALTKDGIDNLTSLSRSVAGLEVVDKGPSDKKLVIRGLTASAGAAQVSTYVDEIPLSSIDSEYALYDVERVEVLRGPQGTLYGDGSQGGTLRYITQKPNFDTIEGSVKLSAGSVDSGGLNRSANAMLNIPLIDDTLAVRAVIGHVDNDGLVNRPELNRTQSDAHTNTNGRLQLLWTPTDDTTVLLAYHTQEVEVEDGSLVGVHNNDVPGKVRNLFVRETQHLNLTVEHATDSGVLTFSASDSERTGLFSFDVTAFNPVPASVSGPSNADADSIELRYVSTLDGPLQFVAGAYHQDLSRYTLSISGPVDLTTGVLPSGYNPYSTPEPDGQNFLLDQRGDVTTKALFGEISYDVTEQLNVLFGVRSFAIDTDITHVVQTQHDVFGRPFGNTTAVNSEHEDSIFKVLVSYDFNENVLLYGTWGEGFRQGGANVLFDPTDTRSELAYSPDYVTNYEFGVKASLADGQVILNSAIYLMEWDDIQVSLLEATRPNEFVTNLGSAELYGLEVEGSITPDIIPGFSITFGVTLSEQELQDDSSDQLGNVFVHKGDSIPNAVSNSASLSLEQQFEFLGLPSYLRFSASYTGDSQTEFSESSTRYREWGDFVTTNLSIGIEEQNWSAALSVDNLSNNRSPLGWSSTFSPSGGLNVDNIYITRPRTIGLSLQYHF